MIDKSPKHDPLKNALAPQLPADVVVDKAISVIRSVFDASWGCVYAERYRTQEAANRQIDTERLKHMLKVLSEDLRHLNIFEIPLGKLEPLSWELSRLVEALEHPVALGILERSALDTVSESNLLLTTRADEFLFKQASLFRDHAYLRNNINELCSAYPDYASEIVDRALGIPYMLSGPWHADHVPDMLGYQPMYVREVIGLVPAMNITPADVFCDLGGGYGRPSLLVHLLSGARCISVEFITSTHEVAKEIAANNGINGVEYVNCDARNFDMSRANKFYLFNPFYGKILDTVVAKLEERVRQTGPEVTIAAHGPCIRAFEQSRFFKRIESPGTLSVEGFFRGAMFKRQPENT